MIGSLSQSFLKDLIYNCPVNKHIYDHADIIA